MVFFGRAMFMFKLVLAFSLVPYVVKTVKTKILTALKILNILWVALVAILSVH